MTDRIENTNIESTAARVEALQTRRSALKKFGRFAGVTAPAVTLLLAAGAKPATAQICSPACPSSAVFKLGLGMADIGAILAAVMSLRYRPDADAFHASFGTGDGTAIEPIDAAGICLAAIKALSARVSSLQSTLAATA